MDTKLTAPTVKILRLREGAEISLRVIAKIIQERRPTGWQNRYDDYNERWIDRRPVWSEHIDRHTDTWDDKWDNKWDNKWNNKWDKKNKDRDT